MVRERVRRSSSCEIRGVYPAFMSFIRERGKLPRNPGSNHGSGSLWYNCLKRNVDATAKELLGRKVLGNDCAT
jgi:hypothetical protein